MTSVLIGLLAAALLALLLRQRRLRSTVRSARALLDGADVGVAHVRAGAAVPANAFLRALAEEVPGLLAALAVLPPGATDEVALAGRDATERRFALRRQDGDTVLCREVTAERQAAALLQQSEARFRQTFESSPVGMVLVAAGRGTVLAANGAFASFLGTSSGGLVGTELRSLLVDGDDLARTAGTAGRPVELQYRAGDGTVRWGATAQAVVEQVEGADLLLLQVEDIDERVTARLALAHQATHDPLTGLANRRELVDHLEQCLRSRRRDGDDEGVGLLFVDLDGFKHVNDTYGHDVGDAVLTATAVRLQRMVRGDDQVARLGGDEFVVVAAPPADQEHLLDMARRLRTALSAPVMCGSTRVRVTASIGISSSRDGQSAADLLREADTAMYRAKALGRGRFEVYDAALRDEVAERVRIEGVLRDALSTGRLGVAYQPVVDQSGALVAVEALARLTSEEGELLSPAAFIPVAERTGLVVPLGLHVLEHAVAQAAHWESCGTPVRTAVNVSARQLARGDLEAVVLESLERYGLSPELLELEITETALVSAVPATLLQLEHLRQRGVGLALDDYGTGHSSLAYLQRMPATTLKIDASFVAGVPEDPRATAIVRAVAQLATDVGLDCVAEGVETPAQQAWLREHAPQVLLQGFLLGRPTCAESFSLRHVPVPRRPALRDATLARSFP